MTQIGHCSIKLITLILGDHNSKVKMSTTFMISPQMGVVVFCIILPFS